jgi:Uma2 family endonuclease
MAEVGILKPTDRVELIRGEIIEMSPPGRRHIAFVDNLNQLLVMRLAGRAIVSVQNPIVLTEDTEPQPDLAIRRHRAVPYKDREAHAEDVLLLIEVADSPGAEGYRDVSRIEGEGTLTVEAFPDVTLQVGEIFA